MGGSCSLPNTIMYIGSHRRRSQFSDDDTWMLVEHALESPYPGFGCIQLYVHHSFLARGYERLGAVTWARAKHARSREGQDSLAETSGQNDIYFLNRVGWSFSI